MITKLHLLFNKYYLISFSFEKLFKKFSIVKKYYISYTSNRLKIYIISLIQGLQNCSAKGQLVSISGFVDHTVCVARPSLCHCWVETAIANTLLNECACVPIKLVYKNKWWDRLDPQAIVCLV